MASAKKDRAAGQVQPAKEAGKKESGLGFVTKVRMYCANADSGKAGTVKEEGGKYVEGKLYSGTLLPVIEGQDEVFANIPGGKLSLIGTRDRVFEEGAEYDVVITRVTAARESEEDKV
jgi:hypothetical protein